MALCSRIAEETCLKTFEWICVLWNLKLQIRRYHAAKDRKSKTDYIVVGTQVYWRSTLLLRRFIMMWIVSDFTNLFGCEIYWLPVNLHQMVNLIWNFIFFSVCLTVVCLNFYQQLLSNFGLSNKLWTFHFNKENV